ncbi:hypothetical protein THAOC_27926 [Thalassiosira oceanica]|uniref:Uncharacterized protein n=1 Tax=Thalassiosira oceanica TaxID=159749 RepID=K0RKF9_THAOC|nr:hypothetical protein THAOC_27926 [Thalassiosira oceanica]|eukprot:EJK52769.1 hypothetical protein THAOC_27926 [Thalassiosira oceanica]
MSNEAAAAQAAVESADLAARSLHSPGVDVERPRKAEGGQVHDLLRPNPIARGCAFDDKCLLHKEGVRWLYYNGASVRNVSGRSHAEEGSSRKHSKTAMKQRIKNTMKKSGKVEEVSYSWLP